MNSHERDAREMSRGMGVDIAVMDFPESVHVVPASHVKEGNPTFVTTPIEAIESAPRYHSVEAIRVEAKALAKLYATPQAIWLMSDGTFIACAESIDVGLFEAFAEPQEVVPVY